MYGRTICSFIFHLLQEVTAFFSESKNNDSYHAEQQLPMVEY